MSDWLSDPKTGPPIPGRDEAPGADRKAERLPPAFQETAGILVDNASHEERIPSSRLASMKAGGLCQMHWIYLTLAILFEVAGTTCMKLSAGFTKPAAALGMGLFYAICFFFLTLALKKIDVGVAYAVWSGVGVALIASIGVLYFREPMTAVKIIGLLAIIIGVVALNFEGTAH